MSEMSFSMRVSSKKTFKTQLAHSYLLKGLLNDFPYERLKTL